MSCNRGLGQDCSAGPGSACAWYDNIWATQGCLDWYAACDPTNSFYVLNTKGLIVGGSEVLGSTAGSALSAGGGGLVNSLLGTSPGTIPGWIPVAMFGILAFLVIPPLFKAATR